MPAAMRHNWARNRSTDGGTAATAYTGQGAWLRATPGTATYTIANEAFRFNLGHRLGLDAPGAGQGCRRTLRLGQGPTCQEQLDILGLHAAACARPGSTELLDHYLLHVGQGSLQKPSWMPGIQGTWSPGDQCGEPGWDVRSGVVSLSSGTKTAAHNRLIVSWRERERERERQTQSQRQKKKEREREREREKERKRKKRKKTKKKKKEKKGEKKKKKRNKKKKKKWEKKEKKKQRKKKKERTRKREREKEKRKNEGETDKKLISEGW